MTESLKTYEVIDPKLGPLKKTEEKIGDFVEIKLWKQTPENPLFTLQKKDGFFVAIWQTPMQWEEFVDAIEPYFKRFDSKHPQQSHEELSLSYYSEAEPERSPIQVDAVRPISAAAVAETITRMRHLYVSYIRVDSALGSFSYDFGNQEIEFTSPTGFKDPELMRSALIDLMSQTQPSISKDGINNFLN